MATIIEVVVKLFQFLVKIFFANKNELSNINEEKPKEEVKEPEVVLPIEPVDDYVDVETKPEEDVDNKAFFSVDPKRVLCFTGNRNSPNKRADFTGAFYPETLAFMKLWKVPADNYLKVDLDASYAQKRKSVYDFIKAKTIEHGMAPNVLMFCCHGFRYKIELGIDVSHCDEFAALLRNIAGYQETKIIVINFCCSTGNGDDELDGDGGYSDQLRDALCAHGFVECRVIGHSTAGHTVRNPMKRFFEGLGSSVGGHGGMWIVAPSSTLWKKWIKALATDFRFLFPFMTIADIHKELTK